MGANSTKSISNLFNTNKDSLKIFKWKKESIGFFALLPNEILDSVLDLLNVFDLCMLSGVNKGCHELANDPIRWKKFSLQPRAFTLENKTRIIMIGADPDKGKHPKIIFSQSTKISSIPETDYPLLSKIVIMGEDKVGKSSFSKRLINGNFVNEYLSTIGVEIGVISVCDRSNNQKWKVQLWDTSGDKRFRAITTSYLRGSSGAILMYDVTNRNSFEELDAHKKIIEKQGSEYVSIVVVANKIEEERRVTFQEGENYAKEIGAQYIEISVKEHKKVYNVVELIINNIYNKMHKQYFLLKI